MERKFKDLMEFALHDYPSLLGNFIVLKLKLIPSLFSRMMMQ